MKTLSEKSVKKSIFSMLILVLCRAAIGHALPIDHWESVVYDNDIWKYFVANSEPDVAWKTLSFNDNSWSQGPGVSVMATMMIILLSSRAFHFI